MQGHAIAPGGGPALDDDKRAAGYGGQWRERLGGGDGRGDCEGSKQQVDFYKYLNISWSGPALRQFLAGFRESACGPPARCLGRLSSPRPARAVGCSTFQWSCVCSDMALGIESSVRPGGL